MFNTTRGLLKLILLEIITFGIYGLVMMSHISEEINIIATQRDGKHTMPATAVILSELKIFGFGAFLAALSLSVHSSMPISF